LGTYSKNSSKESHINLVRQACVFLKHSRVKEARRFLAFLLLGGVLRDFIVFCGLQRMAVLPRPLGERAAMSFATRHGEAVGVAGRDG